MAGFAEPALQKKLEQLTNTLPSIQTLSLWLLHHRKHSASIVKVWYNELKKEKQPKKILNLVYLANDVIQNARKKWPLFLEQFQPVLDKGFGYAARHVDPATLYSIQRVIEVWRQRKVFSNDFINKLNYAISSNLSKEMLAQFNKNIEKLKAPATPNNNNNASGKLPSKSPAGNTGTTPQTSGASAAQKRRHPPDYNSNVTAKIARTPSPPAPKTSTGSSNAPTASSAKTTQNGGAKSFLRDSHSGSSASTPAMTAAGVVTPLIDERSSADRERLISLRSPDDIIAQAPKTDELIKALRLLESPASADAETRQKIAQFPPDIADASKLCNLTTKFQAERFSQVVAEADQMLKSYNQRLMEEMNCRTSTLEDLQSYCRAQKCLLEKDQANLSNLREKLVKLSTEKHDLHQHVDSLPDLSKLPDFTRLPPLPSAGDLFLKNTN